jgi:hypothetical protein
LPEAASLRDGCGRVLLLATQQRRLVKSVSAGRNRLWRQLQHARANAIRSRLRAIGLRNKTVTLRLVFGEAASPDVKPDPARRRPRRRV